jgi:hypothetical protein
MCFRQSGKIRHPLSSRSMSTNSARVGNHIGKVRVTLEDTTIDHTGQRRGRLVHETDPDGKLVFVEAIRLRRMHRMLDGRSTQRVQARPDRLQ